METFISLLPYYIYPALCISLFLFIMAGLGGILGRLTSEEVWLVVFGGVIWPITVYLIIHVSIKTFHDKLDR